MRPCLSGNIYRAGNIQHRTSLCEAANTGKEVLFIVLGDVSLLAQVTVKAMFMGSDIFACRLLQNRTTSPAFRDKVRHLPQSHTAFRIESLWLRKVPTLHVIADKGQFQFLLLYRNYYSQTLSLKHLKNTYHKGFFSTGFRQSSLPC
jgi:hypothetical protein